MTSLRSRAAFRPIHTVVVPVFHDATEQNPAALASLVETARLLASEVVLVGIVRVASEEAMSAAAATAQELRAGLGALAGAPGVTVHAHVYASTTPLAELERVVQELTPDLLLLDWDVHLIPLASKAAQLFEAAPGPVALLRGRFSLPPARVLVPIRGGPHAILAVRMGLALRPAEQVVLHVTAADQPAREEAPFLGLQRVLPQIAGITTRAIVTSDPAQAILDESQGFDLVILGATARPLDDPTSLGKVADRVLRMRAGATRGEERAAPEEERAVLVVRSSGVPAFPAPESQPESQPESHNGGWSGDQWDAELSAGHAISILVDKWFAEFTFDAEEFADIERLVQRKQEQGLTISLALPALNEQETVGDVVGSIQRALVEEHPLLDEIVLVDSNSTDRTREIAESMGLPVYIHQTLLPRLGARRGKGEALWKSLLVTRGDIVAWIDTDIVNIHPRFVYGIIGPLLLNPSIQFVKGFYRRPINVDGSLQEGGGRVTELMARPLINLFYPELSGVLQPLSGEYAGRRSALEDIRFYSGYGVETGLLIDIFERYGLSALAQVDLKERIHHNQPLGALSRMSFAILQVVMESLEKRLGVDVLADVNKTMKLIRSDESGAYSLIVEEIAERWRPPMNTVEEYKARQANVR